MRLGVLRYFPVLWLRTKQSLPSRKTQMTDQIASGMSYFKLRPSGVSDTYDIQAMIESYATWIRGLVAAQHTSVTVLHSDPK